MQEDKIKKCIKELIDNDFDIYSYVTPKGLKELRISISKYLNKKLNMKINENNMIITSGSQQSIYLLSRTLLTQNDSIISEEPTYFGAIKVFKELKIKVLTIEVNDSGIDINEVKNKVKEIIPKFIYVVPTFNNPTGISWSNENRKEFLKIINENNITVIEDDPYSEFNYTSYKYKTLYELNKGKNIIYLGTFSKIICPSLSVGYILGDIKVIDRLYEYKLLNDMNTSLFIQKFVNLYLNKYDIKKDIMVKKEQYKKHVNIIKKRLSEEFSNISFSKIKGGLFMTVILDNTKIETTLYDNNYYSQNKQNLIRINISNMNIDDIIIMMKNYL